MQFLEIPRKISIVANLSYNELKTGTLFIKEGAPWRVLDYQFVRMQQRKPVAQLKIKNLISGKVVNYTAHQTDNFEEAEIEIAPVVFIYRNKNEYWFHELGNPKNRFALKEDIIGEAGQFLKSQTEIKAFKFGEKIINIELPIKMDFKVIESPPAIKGDTAQGGTKLITLETGAKINAPLFINEGDIITINTQIQEYVERAEKS